ncbi:hypothetical protein [Palleronia caenipelagi]|uniref:Transcriptional regulator n=1 Tax=Palleronia caenipelagi TaxID=2489174 RepID=A0A547PW76_9RHOB|nr:hypothetical protein [Palleronia caenipelagi]TRD18371.1 hypothetical protein FEV53_11995 [Palleronia caenipelagi]
MTPVDHLAKARAAWGEDMPDWIEALARACAETSQNAVARKLGYSAATVSCALSGTYRGNLATLEAAWRGVFERAVVACPILGEIGTPTCRDWRRKSKRLRASNNLNARMFRACRACSHNQKGGATHE